MFLKRYSLFWVKFIILNLVFVHQVFNYNLFRDNFGETEFEMEKIFEGTEFNQDYYCFTRYEVVDTDTDTDSKSVADADADSNADSDYNLNADSDANLDADSESDATDSNADADTVIDRLDRKAPDIIAPNNENGGMCIPPSAENTLNPSAIPHFHHQLLPYNRNQTQLYSTPEDICHHGIGPCQPSQLVNHSSCSSCYQPINKSIMACNFSCQYHRHQYQPVNQSKVNHQLVYKNTLGPHPYHQTVPHPAPEQNISLPKVNHTSLKAHSCNQLTNQCKNKMGHFGRNQPTLGPVPYHQPMSEAHVCKQHTMKPIKVSQLSLSEGPFYEPINRSRSQPDILSRDSAEDILSRDALWNAVDASEDMSWFEAHNNHPHAHDQQKLSAELILNELAFSEWSHEHDYCCTDTRPANYEYFQQEEEERRKEEERAEDEEERGKKDEKGKEQEKEGKVTAFGEKKGRSREAKEEKENKIKNKEEEAWNKKENEEEQV